MEQLNDCIFLASKIKQGLQQNNDEISLCVGPRVADVYEAATENAIKMIRSVQYNLTLLQQSFNQLQ